MKSLFDPEAYTETKQRLEQIDAGQSPEWGRMKPAQMMHHCQKALETPLGKSDLKRPNMFMRIIFRSFKNSMYNDKPWKQNLPTAPGFKVEDERDFETEKKRLVSLLDEFHEKGKEYDWPRHPVFGSFTAQQWGQMQFKHLDHHLRQFGV